MGPAQRCDQKRAWCEHGIADYRNGSPMWLALMFCNFFFTTSNLIARRDRFLELGGFAPLRYCHDLDYVLKAVFAGHQVQFVDETLCDYRIHNRNTIDQDARKVLFEEAWIVAKFMRSYFGRISEAERLTVAQRIADRGIAASVIEFMGAVERSDPERDSLLMPADPRFGVGLEHGEARAAEALQSAEIVRAMSRLVRAEGAEA